jgi:hypothetical protein
LARISIEKPNHRLCRLLPMRGEWPRRRCCNAVDEIAPSHCLPQASTLLPTMLSNKAITAGFRVAWNGVQAHFAKQQQRQPNISLGVRSRHGNPLAH